MPVSVDQVFSKWEAETEPSASTLSSWRGIVRDFKSFLGPKASDVRSITSNDIVKWKDKLVKEGKAAATISRGYLGCARALEKVAAFASCRYGIADRRSRATPWIACEGGRGLSLLKIQPAQDVGTIKNESSERTVPIHSALVKAGFLDFVKARGQGPLFYTRSSGDPKRKHACKGVSNRLAAWNRASGFDDPRNAPNHALRHWFKTEASRVGISDSVADAIQGHSDGKPSIVYRHMSISSMALDIEEIQIPSI